MSSGRVVGKRWTTAGSIVGCVLGVLFIATSHAFSGRQIEEVMVLSNAFWMAVWVGIGSGIGLLVDRRRALRRVRADEQQLKELSGSESEDLGQVLLRKAEKAAARCRFDEALLTYREVIDKFPGTSAAEDARILLKSLQAKLGPTDASGPSSP